MELIAKELEAIISQYRPALQSLDESRLTHKPSPSKWSKKEVIGHMIDSSQSNIRRFIVAQYEEKPTISYNQDKWVAIAGYQQWNSNDLIDLWYLLNRQICEILKNTSAETAQRQCMTEGAPYDKMAGTGLYKTPETSHAPGAGTGTYQISVREEEPD